MILILGPTIFTLVVVWATFPTWGAVVYPELSSFPEWAEILANASQAVSTTVATTLANVTTLAP